MTSCNGRPTAVCLLTTANIPRRLLGARGARGARERDDSELPPGEELGLWEDQMVGRKENVVRKQSKLCFIASFVFILLFNLF